MAVSAPVPCIPKVTNVEKESKRDKLDFLFCDIVLLTETK